MNDWEMDEEAAQRRAERRAKHRQEMLRSKRRQMLFRKLFKLFLPFILGAAVIGLLIFAGTKIFEKAQGTDESNQTISAENLTLSDSVSSASLSDNTVSENEAEEQTALIPTATANEQTLSLGADIVSEHAILVDESQNLILAQKDAQTKIWPASMTKVLTVLVAAEHVTDLDDTFTMTLDITDYSYVNDCSNVGFLEHETVTVRDLFYGTILKSGADAAVGLATYVAGSHEAFVDMMNEKLDELGMSDTAHFT
ncbi:MAG: D-alanyl-D-alanine carboxypeptidase, partial [Clostridia bacterium]|nr:D-alanyl-D-alanine carboxypeptidase [Clostridia bacterium]